MVKKPFFRLTSKKGVKKPSNDTYSEQLFFFKNFIFVVP